MGTGGSYLLAANGRFTASDGTLSAGRIDVNDDGRGTPGSLRRHHQVDANGRGAASLNVAGQPKLSSFVFYVVSAGEMLFMQTDPRGNSSSPAIGGAVLQQSGPPFSPLSLNGPTVLNLVARTDLVVAQQTFDGNGGFSGTLDENNNGIVTGQRHRRWRLSRGSSWLGEGHQAASRPIRKSTRSIWSAPARPSSWIAARAPERSNRKPEWPLHHHVGVRSIFCKRCRRPCSGSLACRGPASIPARSRMRRVGRCSGTFGRGGDRQDLRWRVCRRRERSGDEWRSSRRPKRAGIRSSTALAKERRRHSDRRASIEDGNQRHREIVDG